MQKLKRAIIKEEYIAITGDFEKAIILNQFIYWSERVKDFDIFISQENERAISNGYNETDYLNGWIYKTAEELSQETMLNLSVATIRNHLKVLINLGFIDERNNPKYKWDRTKQYRVNLVNIAKALYDKGFSFEDYKFELPFLNFKNGILEFENQSEKNQNAIPNITTEITTKITNKNKTPLPPFGEEVFNLVEHWNCKGIIRHDIKLWLNDKRNARIKKAINQYGLSQIQTAIDHYATVIQDTKYTLFKYKWDLDQFLKQENALPHFLENGSKWLNYCNWRKQNNKSVTDNLKSYYEKLRAEEENEEISENTLF